METFHLVTAVVTAGVLRALVRVVVPGLRIRSDVRALRKAGVDAAAVAQRALELSRERPGGFRFRD